MDWGQLGLVDGFKSTSAISTPAINTTWKNIPKKAIIVNKPQILISPIGQVFIDNPGKPFTINLNGKDVNFIASSGKPSSSGNNIYYYGVTENTGGNINFASNSDETLFSLIVSKNRTFYAKVNGDTYFTTVPVGKPIGYISKSTGAKYPIYLCDQALYETIANNYRSEFTSGNGQESGILLLIFIVFIISIIYVYMKKYNKSGENGSLMPELKSFPE